MELDLDALCTPELRIKIKGKEYIVSEMEAGEYLSVVSNPPETGDDPSKNLDALKQMVKSLGPGLPPDVVDGCSMRQLRVLLGKLDAFQGGVQGADEGNALGGGGSR